MLSVAMEMPGPESLVTALKLLATIVYYFAVVASSHDW